MNNPLISNFLLLFLISIGVTYLVTPYVERLAFRLGAVDFPSERKVHRQPVPSLGGIAIYLGIISAIFYQLIKRDSIIQGDLGFWGIIFGGTLILLIGVIDDIFDIPPWLKLIGQIGAGFVLVLVGVRIEFVGNPFGGIISLSNYLMVPLTILWVVGMINIINFIDGLDGLASGIVGIASISILIMAYITGRTEVSVLCVVLAGSSFGFLKHNFNPAQIFMGDSGSMLLGFMLGALTVQGVIKSVASIALIVPIIIMAVPIFDTFLAIIRRLIRGQPVYKADVDHIHHRLIKEGFSHRQTVIVIYIWSIFLSAAALVLNFAVVPLRIFVYLILAALSLFFARYIGVFEWLEERTSLKRRAKKIKIDEQ